MAGASRPTVNRVLPLEDPGTAQALAGGAR